MKFVSDLACGLPINFRTPGAICSGATFNWPLNIEPHSVIYFDDFTFSPLDLAAPPGATVTVINNDPMPHSVTSEAAPEQYTPGSVAGVSFDTGEFTGDQSFTLPADAPDGTVVPYYCKVHQSGMTTRTGTITIQASAQPQPAP